MKNKNLLKTVATSAFACVCTAAMVTGILAATSHTVNITTSVSFTASGVSGTFNGYTQTGETKSNYYYTDTNDNTNHVLTYNNGTTFTDWSISAIALTTTDEGAAVATNIVMEFTQSGTNSIGVGITGLGCLCGVTNLDATYTITDAASDYNVTTAQTLVPQLYFEVASTGTTVLTISLSAHDTSVNISTVTVSGVSVNLASTTDTNWKTVTFAAGTGASGTMDAIKAWSGKTVVVPTNSFTAPTCAIFNGWSQTNTGSTPGDPVALTANALGVYSVTAADITLTAQWEQLYTTGTFVAGSGDNASKLYANNGTVETTDDVEISGASAAWAGWHYVKIDNEYFLIIGAGLGQSSLVPSKDDTSKRAGTTTNINSSAGLDSNEILVLSMTQTDNMPFDSTSPYQANWSTSDVRTYLNGTGNNQYLNTHPNIASLAQPKALTTAWKSGSSCVKVEQDNNNTDQVFLLGYKNGQGSGVYSEQNFCIDDYLTTGISSEATRFSSCFWLRSGVSIFNNYAYGVNSSFVSNYDVSGDNAGVRPVFVLQLS